MAGNMTGILSKTRLSFCLITRRGYGAAVSQAETESTKRTLKSKGKQEEERATSESSSWVPDPVTGYYKPSGQTNGPSGQISGPTGPKQEE
uniref:Protein SENESCENCE-ASSOCIATED GENE 21, mitochondrial n=1 Tax=Nicotiana tabacum TaxID=4097 RepID=A0A1S4D406_TOBAC|nr:PREDICTED: protein SENESCENCE-ASSOCIATED GENE 21, mitochondrial-like [Nicotiana tabacum]